MNERRKRTMHPPRFLPELIMSINPVFILEPTGEAQFADANSRRQQPLPAPGVDLGQTNLGQSNLGQSNLGQSNLGQANLGQPNPGTSPKKEARNPQDASASTELPQDEVQVQRDNGIDGEVVVKYLNPAGDVILQIPTSQVLGIANAIGQDFQKAAQARANADATREKEGGETHGH
jgi:Pentapeptide repeats (8 copies)